jgi:hypothetical protein
MSSPSSELSRNVSLGAADFRKIVQGGLLTGHALVGVTADSGKRLRGTPTWVVIRRQPFVRRVHSPSSSHRARSCPVPLKRFSFDQAA